MHVIVGVDGNKAWSFCIMVEFVVVFYTNKLVYGLKIVGTVFVLKNVIEVP